MKKGIGIAVASAAVAGMVALYPSMDMQQSRQMENLSRGLTVSELGNGVLVSWRLLGTEDPGTEFRLYRDGKQVFVSAQNEATSFLDSAGTVSSTYTLATGESVDSVSVVLDSSVGSAAGMFPYKVIHLDVPPSQTMPDGTTCTYYPNDASVGDLDGDGEYEIVLKWDPSNSKDNSQKGYTGTVFIDAYKLDGTRMWRIDFGKNVRAGAHYTQFQVYDYDGDGKAEMIARTSDGTLDGTGRLVGRRNVDYRGKDGMVKTGPEYLTVFRGIDGRVMSTLNYVPSRDVQKPGKGGMGYWGDNSGNRSERFLAATGYLDGVHPSAVFARGYYTAAYVAAFDFDGAALRQRWVHKAETPGTGLYGQGNHSMVLADLDMDGYDEVFYGGAALNHDGSFRYSTGLGHGDAHHISDLDPDSPGLEIWDVHENKDAKYTDELRAPDGKIVWGTPQPNPGVDNGRGMAGDIDSTHRGFEMWSNKGGGLYSVRHERLGDPKLVANFRIYFDADPYDELLDGALVTKYDPATGRAVPYFDGKAALGATGCNGTKNTPVLVADLFGDWREELVVRSETDPSVLYIVGTPVPATFRVYTLMHDPTYRTAVAMQNTAYNQPPHLGYYLPDAVGNLKKPTIYVTGR